MHRNRVGIGALVALAGLVGAAGQAAGASVYALADNTLYLFNSNNPGAVAFVGGITGLQPDETIVGIDFRPATGGLYGLGSTSRLYLIDHTNGTATEVGAGPFATLLSGNAFGFDFNPTVDRIRVTSDASQNLRLHPDTGAVVAVDGTLAYAVGDPNEGDAPFVVGSAYLNSDNDPGTGTTLYNIDARDDILVTQSPPNDGTLNTVAGPGLGFDTHTMTGFDIFTPSLGDNRAFASFTEFGAGQSFFYTVGLGDGSAALVGGIGIDGPILDIAVIPAPPTVAVLGLSLCLLRRRAR